MNELQYVYEKFKSRDIIEVDSNTQVKIIEWATGNNLHKLHTGQVDVRASIKKLSERGFIKFLNKGVIIIRHNSAFKNTGHYVFDFTDHGTMVATIYISNPLSQNKLNTLELLCKVECGTDTLWQIIEGTYNNELALLHIKDELEAERIGMSQITSCIKYVQEHHPNLKPGSDDFHNKAAEEYFATIVKAQVITIIATNAYFALLDKDSMVTKITQQKQLHASSLKEAKRSRRNITYRYVAQVPDNYRPRKSDLNWLVSKWSRAGYSGIRWVRKENAEIIKESRNGVLTGDSRGDYVAIRVPVKPVDECKRHALVGTDIVGVKLYTN